MKQDNNPLQLLGAIFVAAFTWFPGAAQAETLNFVCSWENGSPIEITVDLATQRATRTDGGAPYQVLKVSKWGVWLLVDQPDNVAAAAIQMIERHSSPGGKWLDTVIGITGAVSPNAGGICWEKSK